jgi:hypothetical protein
MKNSPASRLIAACCAVTLASCAAVPWIDAEEGIEAAPVHENPGKWTTTMEGEGPLYGWDGSVAQAPEEGAVAPSPSPLRRETAGAEGSRMYILELYQETVDERDRLRIEIESLEESLARAQTLYDDLWTSHEYLKESQKAMEAEQMAQKTENFDLAARLTTAQIRRLEAEKLLLETRLRWEKTLEEARATNGPTSGQSQ